MYTKRISFFIFFILSLNVQCRRHRLVLKNDDRDNILCSMFGFLQFGDFEVKMEKLEFRARKGSNPLIGFTLDKAENAGISSYVETKSRKCVLTDPSILKGSSLSVVVMNFDFPNNRLVVTRIGKDLQNLSISPMALTDEGPITIAVTTSRPKGRVRRSTDKKYETQTVLAGLSKELAQAIRSMSDDHTTSVVPIVTELIEQKNKTELKAVLSQGHSAFKAYVIKFLKESKEIKTLHDSASKLLKTLTEPKKNKKNDVPQLHLIPMRNSSIPMQFKKGHYTMGFVVTMPNEEDKGLYSLYFHNCEGKGTPVNMTLSLVEKNRNSYLSAGEQPRPLVYFAFCGAYFVLSWVWLVVLRASKKDVYKIHYLMLSLIFVKSIALLFHGVNDYVLGKEGIQEEGWAVMYYITYLMRGSLMLITLILIGAGWTYVKHMLHDREKKILLVGISLHGLRFVANIIIDESEIGSARYTTWKEIFILVDLLSVGLVLFPIVWSIRHLSKASQTDGKAALNLRRLKLFRHFYLMVICFIYTTRIIAYLLAITIPFTHTWLVTLFREATTLIFFVITGFKFRPFDNNPYLLVPDVDLDEDTEEIQLQHVVSQSGYAEGTSRVNRGFKEDVDDEVAEGGEPLDELTKPQNSSSKQNLISHEED